MKNIRLVHVDLSGGHSPPACEVAVAIGESGWYEWTEAQCLGHSCRRADEWDQMIDRLVASLEQVRTEGHAKLAENRRTAHRPARPVRRLNAGRHFPSAPCAPPPA